MRKSGISPVKICLSLIFYSKNKQRFRYIYPKINILKSELKKDYDVSFTVISMQPKIRSQNTTITLMRKIALWRLNRNWIFYKEQKPRNIILDLLILIRRILLTYINKDSENQRTIIDSLVTFKHIEAWYQMLGEEANYLIVFEDDAVFTKTSNLVIKKIIRQIKRYPKTPIYLDLAGGCRPEELQISNLEYKKSKLGRYYRKPVTNTACCYLINDITAELFLSNVNKYPLLRLLPIDWLMNKLFVITAKKNKYFCLHIWPHALEHGTNTGSYKSWLQ